MKNGQLIAHNYLVSIILEWGNMDRGEPSKKAWHSHVIPAIDAFAKACSEEAVERLAGECLGNGTGSHQGGATGSVEYAKGDVVALLALVEQFKVALERPAFRSQVNAKAESVSTDSVEVYLQDRMSRLPKVNEEFWYWRPKSGCENGTWERDVVNSHHNDGLGFDDSQRVSYRMEWENQRKVCGWRRGAIDERPKESSTILIWSVWEGGWQAESVGHHDLINLNVFYDSQGYRLRLENENKHSVGGWKR
jgi:hypothetical protein